MRRRTTGIHKRGVFLHLFDHRFVFLARLYGGYAEGNDLDTAQITPLGRKNIVQRVRDLGGVSRKSGITDAHLGNLRESGLQSGQELGLELSVDRLSRICLRNIAADIGIEQDRVRYAIAVFAEAADRDIDVDAGSLIHYTERYRRRCAVLVADQFLCVEVINSLILGRLAAERESLAEVGEGRLQILSQIAVENRRLGGRIICEFARLRAKLGNLTLIHNDHALSVRYRDNGTVGNDVVRSFGIGGTSSYTLLSLNDQDIRRQRFTVEILTPLIGKHAARCSKSCFNKTHLKSSF